MSTLTPAEPRAATVLARAAAAEWSRIWSVRSTWTLVLGTTFVFLGIATIVGLDTANDQPTGPFESGAWNDALPVGALGMLGLIALAVITTTADHGTGGIVPTLQWTPRRSLLLAARTGVVAATASLFGLALFVSATVVIWSFMPALGLPAGDGARILGDVAFVYASGTLLAVGLGLLLRSSAGALISVLALMLVLPLLLALFGFDWAERIGEFMPGTGALHLMLGFRPDDMTPDASRLVLSAWAVGSVAAGGWRLLRADMDG